MRENHDEPADRWIPGVVNLQSAFDLLLLKTMNIGAHRTHAVRTWYQRRAAIAAVLCSAALVAACTDPTGPVSREAAPEEFEFSIGGFGVGWRSWELRGDTIVYYRVPWDYYPGSPDLGIDSARVVPTPEVWHSFWSAAEHAGVSRWRRRYVAAGVVDGLGWRLHLRSGGLRVNSEGSNAYPDRRGRKHELDLTPQFQAFLSELEELVGKSP